MTNSVRVYGEDFDVLAFSLMFLNIFLKCVLYIVVIGLSQIVALISFMYEGTNQLCIFIFMHWQESMYFFF